MKKKIFFFINFLFCFLLQQHTLFAQQQPTANKQLKLFFEKIYLHTDRDYYLAGEDIWFKAYLVNAQSNFPTYTSNNLYVDLVNSQKKVVLKSLIRLDNGLGNGDFLLPDTLTSGNYQLRAYTNWMRNFGDQFIFQKNIFIGSNEKSTSFSLKNNANANTINPSKVATNEQKVQFTFFPEGGNLIADMQNTIAFKAEDANGKSVMVKGKIMDAQKNVVANFESTKQGLGSFKFKPLQDALYDVEVINIRNNESIEADLPIAINKGLIITTNSIDDTAFTSIIIKTNIQTSVALQNTYLGFEIKHFGKKVYADSLHLTGETTVVKIANSLLGSGISIITLFDAQKRPISERLFYVDKLNEINVVAETNKKIYSNKEDVEVAINAYTTNNKPISANISMAVVDAQFVPVAATNIVSYLMLQSEIKGNIENANQYFDLTNKNRLQQLDLLLLTQGWRTYLWVQLLQQNLSIKYLPEAGITISGSVQKTMAGKPLADANITLTAPDAIGIKRFAANTDSTGKFYVDGINFSGLQRFKLASRNNKGIGYGYITLDSLRFNALPASTFFPKTFIYDTLKSLRVFTENAKLRNEEASRLKSIAVNEILPEIVVKSSREKTVNLRDGTYMDGGFKDSVFMVDPLDMQRFGTLETYLVNKVNGVQIDAQNGGILLGPKGKRPRFVIDNREDLFERLDYYTLPMNVISKVVIKRALTIDGTMDDIFIIYLTLKPEANQQNNPDVLSTDVMGYYQARSFYAPQVKSNVVTKNYLTTLYWNPSIIVNNGKAKVVIDGRKMNTKWNIIIEGIAENGTPIFSLLSYEVQ